MVKSGETVGAKLKVFISYSRKDIDFAQRLVLALEARGLAAAIDTRDLPTLEDWRRELLSFIRGADAVVFVVSMAAVASPVCAWEIEQVTKLNKRLAPIVLEQVLTTAFPTRLAKSIICPSNDSTTSRPKSIGWPRHFRPIWLG